MRELEALLKWHNHNIKFDYLNNCIYYYPHIINICSSYIIALSTHIFKQFLETLKSESDGNLVYFNINDNDDDDNNNNNNNNNNKNKNDSHLFSWETDISKLVLDKKQVDILDDGVWALYTGLKHNPIKYTCRIVCIMCLLDQRKQVFKNVIKIKNHNGWFRSHDNEVIKISDLKLLCNVKTR